MQRTMVREAKLVLVSCCLWNIHVVVLCNSVECVVRHDCWLLNRSQGKKKWRLISRLC